jgi:hypothetical protein
MFNTFNDPCFGVRKNLPSALARNLYTPTLMIPSWVSASQQLNIASARIQCIRSERFSVQVLVISFSMIVYILIVVAFGARITSAISMTGPTVQLDNAIFTGKSLGLVSEFLGIPFAKPP